MSYTVFARKYRPQTFDDVIGQEHITTTLKNAIEQQRLAHAYIFVGPRGTGKTSTARIMAKALNCEKGPTILPCGNCDACREIERGTGMDVMEFDAASNTQVDKIREIIIENVKYQPTRGKYKIYIVDEVHMLSASSFNALLKTLEEPPPHVMFIFATTNIEKVPTTILSRCQRFDLKRISVPLISGHLLEIARKENIALSTTAADTLGRGAEGGMRDAESMLDQLVAFCGDKIEEADVLKIFGFTAKQTVANLSEFLIEADVPRALGLIHEQAEAGKDLSRLLGDLITHLRNLLVSKADPGGVKDELGDDALAALAAQAGRLPMSKLLELIEQFASAEAQMKWAPNKRMHFEIAIIRAVQTLSQASLTDVIEALAAMRDGKEIAPPAPRPSPAKPVAKPLPSPAVEKSVAPPTVAVPQIPAEPLPQKAPNAPTPEPPALTPVIAESAGEHRAVDAPPAPAAPPITPENLWSGLLVEIRRQRPLIAMWVEAGTVLDLDANSATVGFPTDSLAPEYCDQPGNRGLLEEIASKLAGRVLKFKFVKRAELKTAVENKPAQNAETPVDPVEAFKNDPLIRKALELFKAEIQPA